MGRPRLGGLRAGWSGGLLGCLAACGGDVGLAPPPTDGAVVVPWEAFDQAAEPMLPYQLEIQSDVIVVARTQVVEQRRGQSVLGLRIEDTLKGVAAGATLFPPDSQPWFGCILPARIPRPSELYPPDSEVLVYLTIDGAGEPQILLLHERPEDLAPLRRFLALYEAARGTDPDWDELWPPDPAGLGDLAFYAFGGGGQLIPGFEGVLVSRLGASVDRWTGAGAVDPSRLQRLVMLVNTYRPPAALPVLARLLDQVVELSREGAALRSVRVELLPDRRLLKQLTAEEVVLWSERLERVLVVAGDDDAHLAQSACFGLSALPHDRGFPILLRELQAGRVEAANPLLHWLQEPRPQERVAELERAVHALLDEADRASERGLRFARHLETIAARLEQVGR